MKKSVLDALVASFEYQVNRTECSLKDNKKMWKDFEKSGNVMLAGFHCGACSTEEMFLSWLKNVLEVLKEEQ